MTPQERFDDLVDAMTRVPGVVPPAGGAGFGRSALRVHGKIFAMFVRGELVLKLPKTRVSALVDAGQGLPFDANKGTPMKEWFAVDVASELDWHALAQEALDFVGSGSRTKPRT